MDEFLVSFVGTYSPIKIENLIALDVPYILKALILLIMVKFVFDLILVVTRGLFR